MTRILVVEDERIVALNLKQRLNKLGYEVAALATSGKQALSEIDRLKPDLVLMDVNIEGDMDGIETASLIPAEYQTPVIYLTAYSEEGTLERARTTRPYGFLLKPFSERELHATIQMVLERRRADVIVRQNEQRLQALVEERTAALEKQISERIAAEDALRQSQKMEAIGQLTGGIAHDFNNLLQGITGWLTLIQKSRELSMDVDIDSYVGSAMNSANRAASLVHSLLAFSRRQPLDPKTIELSQLVENITQIAKRAMGASVEINFIATDQPWRTRCDLNQLESAILNLAINARDAMPNGGKLTIETANVDVDAAYKRPDGVAPGQYVCISVSDTGVGMEKDVESKAFEPFFTTKPTGQGTGLGLSMVYGFARQSGGFAKIHSQVGKGTTVKIYLPRSLGTESKPIAEVSSIAMPAARVGSVVLVIEDDAVVRGFVTEVLARLGYKVLEAVDGPTGLDLLRSSHHIDLLLTDVGLPGLNGRQVADAARETRPDLKVIFMTGYAEIAAGSDGFLEPGMKMITKPFKVDVLAERVRESLQV